MDWLLAPIDPSRAHEIGQAASWHARTMVLAWGVVAPLAVLVARFFKVMPGQDFPRTLDRQFWWRAHWGGQVAVLILSLVGLQLILGTVPTADGWHGVLGYGLLGLMILQIALGLMRGSKGGPTARAPDGSWRGDHYDMTRWRMIFETVHKSAGYAALALATATILLGLWTANAPNWMWLMLGIWWMWLTVVFALLQGTGHAVDTYQAIWGPGTEHPGNRRPHVGWGMRRIREETQLEDSDVRNDRGDRVRGH